MSKTRVVVGMSGGVDSTVAAAILLEKGYEVIGMTMTLSTPASRCCSDEDVTDARRMAQKLDIPHYVIPMHKPFREHVVDYFIAEYTNGHTPNPCAICNPTIKFGELLDKAREVGAELLATGHYAVVTKDENIGRYLLKRGKEHGKDQSYFLARLSQNALSRTLFPVGTFPKNKIRDLARRLDLDVSDKSESQDVCFVPDSGVAQFIEDELGHSLEPGPIKNKDEEILGTHQGIAGYTIGQRKGLGIAVGRPIYVTRIEAESNTIFVGDEDELYHNACTVSDPNWIGVNGLNGSRDALVRIRYNHRPTPATITMESDDRIHIHFKKPQRAITPGQLAVFYDGESVLGSAWIDTILNQ
ncbi:tRNA 2-thiouridine(34) synthase MnmA [candidate division KSB1 bacterium]|nr:tRNA 2-thiouridine(34) synthase MnmA [candidate division KSB1 bacterium]